MSRATIYRNWPDAADLVSALLDQEARDEPPDRPGSGTAEELTELTVGLGQRLADPELTALLLAGVESARRSTHAADSTRQFLTALFAPLVGILMKAVDDGLVEGDPTELLADLVGPLLADLLIGRTPAPDRSRQVARRFLSSHRPPTRTNPARSGPTRPGQGRSAPTSSPVRSVS